MQTLLCVLRLEVALGLWVEFVNRAELWACSGGSDWRCGKSGSCIFNEHLHDFEAYGPEIILKRTIE